MPGKASLQMIGNWDKEVGVALKDALAVSMDVMGRTGEEACKHAIILMAESARSLTPQSKAKRPIVKNPDDRWKTDRRRAPYGVMAPTGTGEGRKMAFRPIFRTGEFGKYRFYDKKSVSWFEHWGPDKNKWRQIATGAYPGADVVVPGIMQDKRRNIGRRGLAKSSWMWGAKQLGARGKIAQKEIFGVTDVKAFTSRAMNGYILSNRLRYLNKILPAGWESTVQMNAGKKIMGQARNKLEARWRREMGMPRRGRKEAHADNQVIAKYFLRGLR